jgi:hypothetical protein
MNCNIIGYAKRKFKERRARYEEESPTERAGRRTANAAWFTGILTVAIAGVGFAQWWVLSGTLDEMRAEQRPAIWIGDNWGKPEYWSQTDQVFWDVHYTNRGRGLVKNGTYQSFIKVGEGDYVRSYGQPPSGVPIAPLTVGQDLFVTIVGTPHQTSTPFDTLIKKDNMLSIKVIFDYIDLGGAQFQSQFCVKYLAAGAVSYCNGKNDNYIK